MGLFERLRRGGLALAMAGAAFAAGLAAAPVQAEPAIWEAKLPGGGTAYLFGTFHLMRPNVSWYSPKVQTAFESSQELWLEIREVDEPQAIKPLLQKYGYDAAHPLSGKLGAADRALLTKDATAAGMHETQLEPMRPWLAALLLSMAPVQKAGYGADNGVDLALKGKAVKRSEPVEAFETMEQQLRYFADLPAPVEVNYLHQTLKEFDLDLKELDEAAGAWAKGDVAGIDRVLMADMRTEAPELYEILLKQRNEAMADQIAARLAKGGTVFVAVGAGHLTGPDGIQKALERRGVTVKRL
jgi:uncharacterized protein YbaP (TraB family)